MKNPIVVLVVSLGLLGGSGCGPSVSSCHFDSDCQGDAVCTKGVCVEKEEQKPKMDGGFDAGESEEDSGEPESEADAGVNAGEIADAGVAAGMPDPMMVVDAGMQCVPRKCSDVGATCGQIPDLCGGTLSCGSCSLPETCGAVLSGRCGCVPKTCSQLGKNCGSVDDGCGHALSCGDPSCGGGQNYCDGANTCQCRPKTCASYGAMCGVNLPDGCGGTIPSCGAQPDCGGGQWSCTSTYECKCTPKTCAQIGAACGAVSDGCGATLNCGTCGPFYNCGPSNQCVCADTVDQPDDQFQDTNCDGIDGDKSKAVFLDANGGTDWNDGTFGHPVQSLSRALALTSSSRNQIYAIGGSYTAPNQWPAGISLYGGYLAPSWARSASTLRPFLRSLGGGLLLQNVNVTTTFAFVEFFAAKHFLFTGTTAVRVIDSGTNVRFSNCVMTAGDGLQGDDATAGMAGLSGAPGANGIAANPNDPNWAGGVPVSTAGGGSNGGKGGRGGSGAPGESMNGLNGANGTPNGGLGGIGGVTACGIAGNGTPGMAGQAAASGTPGVSGSGVGLINANGYWNASPSMMGSRGTDGASGPGGGGGGGGAKLHCTFSPYEAGGYGGGGGEGGRGGFGGPGGGGGGASIGLQLIRSNPYLNACRIVAGNGGVGGAGGIGGAGGSGGAGGTGGAGIDRGNGYRSGAGGAGGVGGRGGNGGQGGSGARGPSIGIWCESVSGTLNTVGVVIATGTGGIVEPKHACP